MFYVFLLRRHAPLARAAAALARRAARHARLAPLPVEARARRRRIRRLALDAHHLALDVVGGDGEYVGAAGGVALQRAVVRAAVELDVAAVGAAARTEASRTMSVKSE